MCKVKEILEKQLQLLSERSKEIVRSGCNGDELPLLTDTMIKLAVILEPETPKSEELSDKQRKKRTKHNEEILQALEAIL